MRTAVDTNVLSAIWNGEPTAEGLTVLLGAAAEAGSVVLCAAVYAELIARPKSTQKSLHRFIADTRIVVDFEMTEQVWVQAGRAFRQYSETSSQIGSRASGATACGLHHWSTRSGDGGSLDDAR